VAAVERDPEQCDMREAAGDISAAQAAAYVRGRPDYPVALEAWLRRDLGLGTGKVVVDLGAGTGKLLPRLLAVGADVMVVEPSVAMRSQLTARFPHVNAREGRAQAMPLADRSADAVICAQCFHWFATEEALAEIHRVLKPGGRLGLVWNIRDTTTPWVARIIEIMAPYDPGTPDYESQEWRKAFPADGFSELREHAFANPQTGPPERVIMDRVLSVGSIATLPRIERDRVIARVQDVIDDTPELAGKPEITFPNTTFAYDCRVAA
jgi:SAM-dependent methyltransferase